jgi:hypothetical protein
MIASTADAEAPTADELRELQRCGKPWCTCAKPDGLVHCPVHDPNEALEPHLTITDEGDGEPAFKCLAGCPPEHIRAVLEEDLRRPVGRANVYRLDRQLDQLPQEADPWPRPIAAEAFYGLAGDVVRTIEPTTEADPVALLVQLLAFFGNCAGREPHWMTEDTRHGLNEFVAIVGVSSKGRKGTSEARIRSLFDRVDEEWTRGRVSSGLSSGEGLIYHVRDAALEADKKTGELLETDPGVQDKRLLVVETELATVLRRQQGEANSLSAVLRDAWDGRVLNTLTKNSRNQARTNHISVVGHITKSELTRYLTSTEAANGFANRFLFALVRRARELPFGASPPNVNELVSRLHDALMFAKETPGPIEFDQAAASVWERVYGPLSHGKPGLLGAVIARSEPHVRRLATIYAVLDLSHETRLEHLLAALAVWDYCEASARLIFGDALGDPDADDVMDALLASERGLTTNELRDHFQRHWSGDRLRRALSSLMAAGMVGSTIEKGRGRPAARYSAARRSLTDMSYLDLAKNPPGAR